MTRITLILSVAGLSLLSLAGCAPIESGEPTGEPIVGRLQFNDRVVDLTPNAFADGPNAVPKDAIGHIIADIDLPDDTRKGGAAVADDGKERRRGLRR